MAPAPPSIPRFTRKPRRVTDSTAPYAPRDPNFEGRVRASFARQRFMAMLGVTCTRVVPGGVVLEFPFREDLTQQHEFLHAGVVTAVVAVMQGTMMSIRDREGMND